MAGKYGYRKKTNRRRNTVRKTPFKKVNTKALAAKAKTRTLVKLIKGVQLNQCETCYRTFKIQSFSLNHNVIARLTLWDDSMTAGNNLFPTQGDTDGNRRGDEIITQGIRLRMIFNVPYDRRNSMFKIFFVPYNTVQGDPYNRTDLLHDITGTIMLDPLQTDRWPNIMYLGKYSCRSKDLQGSDHHTILINRWIPMKRKLKFLNDGSIYPSNIPERGAIVILPYSTTGALETDTIANNCQLTATLYYKDP